VDRGCENCPLCVLRRRRNLDDECYGCPVEAATGKEGCAGTPYAAWARKRSATREAGWAIETPAQREAAHAMILFLQSLLPKKAALRKTCATCRDRIPVEYHHECGRQEDKVCRAGDSCGLWRAKEEIR
jgi:hypothetical protein